MSLQWDEVNVHRLLGSTMKEKCKNMFIHFKQLLQS